MSRNFLDDPWGHILPALTPDTMRAFQVRAVAWGERVGYSTDEHRDALEMLGLLEYESKPRTDR